MIHTLTKPSSFMTFYFADIPGSDTESIVEMDITDYEPFQIKIAEANQYSTTIVPIQMNHGKILNHLSKKFV